MFQSPDNPKQELPFPPWLLVVLAGQEVMTLKCPLAITPGIAGGSAAPSPGTSPAPSSAFRQRKGQCVSISIQPATQLVSHQLPCLQA